MDYKLEYVICTVVFAVCLLCEQYGGQITIIVYVNVKLAILV